MSPPLPVVPAFIHREGWVLPVDEAGYIVNLTSASRLQPHWAAAVAEAVRLLRLTLDDAAASLYLRGSIALGRAIDRVSDMDLILIHSEGAWDGSRAEEIHREVCCNHPFVTFVDIHAISFAALGRDPVMRFGLKTQALWLHGPNLLPTLPFCRPGPAAVVHGWQLASTLKGFRHQVLIPVVPPHNLAQWTTWLGKLLLRTGFELVMTREACYTRDLYPCFEAFARHYPDRAGQMLWVLEQTIRPQASRAELAEIIDELGTWLSEEVSAVLGLALLVERMAAKS